MQLGKQNPTQWIIASGNASDHQRSLSCRLDRIHASCKRLCNTTAHRIYMGHWPFALIVCLLLACNLIPVTNRHYGANYHHQAAYPQHIDLWKHLSGHDEHVAVE